MSPFPLGGRGERGVLVATAGWIQEERYRTILDIPGVVPARGGFRCTWDAAWILSILMGHPEMRVPLSDPDEVASLIAQMPGLAEYRALGFPAKLRVYQKESVIFLALRAWAMCCDVMRLGKTLIALAAAILRGAKRVLVICPALPKLGWAEEIAKWTEHEAVLCEGRAANTVRVFCKTCMGTGRLGDDDDPCPDCRMLNGQSRGLRLIDASHGTCTKHGHDCPECKRELDAALLDARFVVINYELLQAQKARDAAGREFYRDDLPGWSARLSTVGFDLCVVDELHYLRRWDSDERNRGHTRREVVNRTTDQIPVVWGLTGTPQFGFTRDWWGQVDTISKGAAVSRDDRLPFAWHARYAGGMKGDYGWVANGSSRYAETEWPRRLEYFMIRHPREVALKEMPPKTRQVVRVETCVSQTAQVRVLRGKLDDMGKVKALMLLSARSKLDTVKEAVIGELADGAKVTVVCFNPDTAKLYAESLEKAIRSSEVKTRMRQVEATIWCAHGDVPTEGRYRMGQAFREHTGAGVFIMTIDAFQVGVSLKGAITEHWVDVHHDPAAMLQAEDRAYEPGITHGLSIIYYVAKDTIDEHRIDRVLPKLEALSRVVGDADAASAGRTLSEAEEKESMKDVLARLTRHLGVDARLVAEPDIAVNADDDTPF